MLHMDGLLTRSSVFLPSTAGVVCVLVTLRVSVRVSEFTVGVSMGGGEVDSITV